MKPRLVLVVLWGATLAGCLEPTQIVVVVHTDMETPGELDQIAVTVTGPGTQDDRGPFDLTGEPPFVLPASFGVRPRGGDADRRVTVAVDARRFGGVLFTTRAATTFVEGKKLRLDVFLAERCITALPCVEPGTTCTQDGCVPEWRDPGDLPEWQGMPQLDAGGADAAHDAGPSCGDGAVPGAWAAVVASGGFVTATDVAIDGEGRAHVVGTFRAAPTLQQGGAVAAEGNDAFWVCFDRLGCPCWEPRILGGREADVDAVAMAFAPDGDTILALTVPEGTLCLGANAFEGPTGVVARLAPSGEVLEGVRVNAVDGWVPQNVGVTSSGEPFVAALARGLLSVGSTSGNGPELQLSPFWNAVLIVWDAELSNPRIGTVTTSADVTSFFATQARDGGLVTTGTLVEGLVSVNGTVSVLLGEGSSFVAAFDPTDAGTLWSAPLVGGMANWPRIVPAGDEQGALIFSAGAFPPELRLAGQTAPVVHGMDTGVASITNAGELEVIGLLGAEEIYGALDAAAAGPAAFVVGMRADGAGFVVGVDEQLGVYRQSEDLAGSAALVAASPSGDAVVVVGVLAAGAELGGHPVGLPNQAFLYAYSFDPTQPP